MLNRIAKKIFLSYLKTKNDFINKQIEYAHKLFNQFDCYFTADLLNQRFVQQTVYADLGNLSDEFKDQIIEVTVLMFYVDKINKEDYIDDVMKPEYDGGMGQALVRDGKKYIVIYGSTDENDHCHQKSYFQETFTHELMHMFDKIIDDNYGEKFYFGHPVDGFKDNKGIPYPGMYGDDDDLFEEQFAEYYTCKAERKEYMHDLMCTLEDYMQENNLQLKPFILSLIELLNDKQGFKELAMDFKKRNLNYSPLAFIYHLAFSKQKNGNKDDAVKILEDLYE